MSNVFAGFFEFSKETLPKKVEAWLKTPKEYHDFVQAALLYSVQEELVKQRKQQAEVVKQLEEVGKQLLAHQEGLLELLRMVQEAGEGEGEEEGASPEEFVALAMQTLEGEAGEENEE